MNLAKSKLTAQGQISVPAEVRRRLAVGPGSVIEWDEQDNQIVVRRVGKYSSAEIHDEVFAAPPAPKNDAEIKAGIADYVRHKHARR